MAAITPDEGKIDQLDSLIASKAADLRLRLYQNNYTPVPGSTAGSFTDCTYDGYAEQTPVFPGAAIDANDNSFATAPTLTFLCTGSVTPNNVYGYYLLDVGTGKVQFAERFAGAPLAFNANGVNVQIGPTWYSGPVTPPL